MRTVTLEVGGLETGLGAFRQAWKSGQAEDAARISFTTPELLWKIMTAKRWELLKALAGKEPMTLRGVAREVARDVKAVHGDVRALIGAGILRRAESGRISFPYDSVHIDFMLVAA